jgi:uncharacterized membrane protein (DUF4010 family)
MELPEIFTQLGIALGLGLLVGLQRQRAGSALAGFRTFPLITLLGALCALLSREFGGWILGGGLAALAVIIVAGNLPVLKSSSEPPGVTTEAALLLMFVVGASLMAGLTAVAVAITGTVAVLLYLKPQMHTLAAKIGENDFKAMMQFALVSLVILPVLPNQSYGPYLVWNPFKIWLMVVLIVGISLGGYISYKFVGMEAGAWAGGILGGLISSTATTVSYARHSRTLPDLAPSAAFVILLSSAIVFVRVLILISVTAPKFLPAAAWPMSAMFAVLAAFALWAGLRRPAATAPTREQANPSELRSAILFALLFATVLLAVAAAKDYLGQSGLYIVAALSGMTDMDAITLSMTDLVNTGKIPPTSGWRCILVAAMSNLAFKAATVGVLGHRRLFLRTAVAFAAAGVVGGLLLALLE